MWIAAPGGGPDYRCVGQGDNTFLCDKLTMTFADFVVLGVVGVLMIVIMVLILVRRRA